MSKTPFFVTTPIYYSNGIPHVGHSYSSLIADVIANYKRIKGFDVKFSTGVDENSQKVVEKATEAGMATMEYADKMAAEHKKVWDGLGISYTDFIRTTEPRHHAFVKQVLQETFDWGDIYQGEYEWLYCVGCEWFKKPSDLTADGLCPDHLKAPTVIKEKNWFFRLSKYQDKLLEFYEKNPNFVIPQNRFNEVIEFLKQEKLEDLSISRETNTFGIPLPFDATQVTYVWYDALLNYITVCQWGDERFWPASLHIVGKDIIKFHAIYWPAMLMAVDYPLPKNILATGFFTIDGQKISKSLGNVIDPVEFRAQYSRELLLNYLLSSIPVGGDGDFSEKEAVLAFNAKLANNVGNLLNRFLVLSLKAGGEVPACTKELLSSYEYSSTADVRFAFVANYGIAMDVYNLRDALHFVYEFGDTLNKFLDTEKPWDATVSANPEKVLSILSVLWEWLRTMALALHPFFSEKMEELLSRIGLEPYKNLLKNGELDPLFSEKPAFSVKEKGFPLFERIVDAK